MLALGEVIKFPDEGSAVRLGAGRGSAIVIILPIVRIERYDDAVAPVMGRPMRPGFARRLRRKMREEDR
jgi:hypothetical protein